MPIIIETIITDAHSHSHTHKSKCLHEQRPWSFTRSFIHPMSCACLLFFSTHSWKPRNSKIEVEWWCACVHRNENLLNRFECGWKGIECVDSDWYTLALNRKKFCRTCKEFSSELLSAELFDIFHLIGISIGSSKSGQRSCGWTWTHWDPFYNFFGYVTSLCAIFCFEIHFLSRQKK